MVPFTLRLLGRSMRWVAPVLVALVWVLLVVAGGGPARAAAVDVFPAHAILLCWLTVVIGNIDDDGHRELCTAIVGSPRRLLVSRALAALVLAAAAAAMSTVLLALVGLPRLRGPSDWAAVFALELAGGIVGVGIGSLLHRPLVRHVGVTVLAATVGLVLCTATAPVTSLLRQTGAGDDTTAYVLLVAASLLALAAAGAATAVVARFAR